MLKIKLIHMIWQISILCGLLLIRETQAATNVSGVLLRNTIWTATGSPYYLVNDVQIPRNATLTIENGVNIYFDLGDFEILVKGFLKVQGASAQQITFKGESSSDQKSMIRFQSTQLSSSLISYAQFNGPKKTLMIDTAAGGLPQNTDTLPIVSTTFSAGTAIGAQGSYSLPPLEFRSCSFTNTTLTNSYSADQPILIVNSTIFYSTFIPRCPLECIQINNSTVRHTIIRYDQDLESRFNLSNSNALNTTVTHYSQYSGSSPKFTITKSIINDFKMVTPDWSRGIRTVFIFEDSTLFNISTPTYTEWYTSSLQNSFTIRRCKFTLGNIVVDGSYSSRPSVISISIIDSFLTKVNFTPPSGATSQYDTTKPLYMRNVSFVDGTVNFPKFYADIGYSNITLVSPLLAGGNSNISCSSIGRSGQVSQNNTIGIVALGLNITYSTIKNFAIGIQVYTAQINQTTISKSNFYGNSVYNIQNSGPYNVTATGNYWGTNNVGVIISKIYDYWDNINYGDIIYTNYSSSLLAAEAGCRPYQAGST